VLGLTLVLLAAARAGAPVLPGGQEDAVATLLGRGAELPGGCTWTGAAIERDFVRSTYACRGAPAVLELRHPSASDGGACGGPFCVTGDAPAELLAALAERARALESTVRWEYAASVAPHTAAPAERPVPPLRLGLLAAAVAWVLALTALAITLRWRLQRAGARAWLELTPRALRLAGCAACGALFCFSTLAALHAFGAQLFAFAWAPSALWGSLVAALAAALAPTDSLSRGWAAWGLGVLAMSGLAFARSLPTAPLRSFGEVTTVAPGVAAYPLNAHGLRGPEWTLARPPGTFRVAVVGDSFVAGVGLADEADTLPAQLQRELSRRVPGARIEVLNLGIEGNNLGAHVDLADAAAKLAAPDALVLCVTLNNDLSSFDGQVARREARRPSLLSVARFFLGRAGEELFWRLTEVHEVNARELAWGREQLSRLTARRGAWPPLVVFSFHVPEPSVRALFTEASLELLTPATYAGDEFIPGDGHPTAAGAGKFARQLADALEGKVPR
jgi:lysophospholipase L1-like esterase